MITAIEEISLEPKKVVATLAPQKFERKIYWRMTFLFIAMHLLFLHSTIYVLPYCQSSTLLYPVFACICLTAIGATAGSHRLFAHKCYKVTTPLKIFLVILQTLSGQESALKWSHDHRQHHKYSDTDADPHNPKIGFFFAHMGWLLSNRHPLAVEKRKTVDISDLKSDPIIMFQHKYYWYLFTALSAIVLAIPYYLLNESLYVSFVICIHWRFVYGLNTILSVNSVAHSFGNRPYNKAILPGDNGIAAFFTFGEGYHNYHHAFPWDYKGSEIGFKYSITTVAIRCPFMIGYYVTA